MNLKVTAVFGSVVAMALLASPSFAEVKIGWKGGTTIEDKDAGYSIKFGGRIMHDWWFIDADDELKESFEFSDGSEFRRARFFTSGTIYRNAYFKAQYDYADGINEFKDVFVGVKGIPVIGAVQSGHMYEPFGLERQTSSKVITFMERALTSAMVPSRNSGIMFKREFPGKRATIAGGVFRNSDVVGFVEDHDYNFTARITAVPIKDDDNHTLVHLGAAISVREPSGDRVKYSTRASTHVAPKLAETDILKGTDQIVLFGGEAAAVYGRASLQGEFIGANTSNDSLNDPSFSTFYVQASIMLTGESRGYKNGLMGGVTPKENFDGEGGIGAWELAARFARADFVDGGVDGGELSDVTIGLNWYLNPSTRIMFNYVYGDLENVGTSNAFMTRFQIAF